jgi:hypothetical protein
VIPLFFWVTVLVTLNVCAQISDSPGSANCPPTVNLTVTVTTEAGAVIPNALVILREDTLGQARGTKIFELELRTTDSGEVSAAVPCNYLDVFIAHDGFAPAAQKLLITNDTNTFSFPLKTYPITRTTEVRVQGSQLFPLPNAIAQTWNDLNFVIIAKPTILAFFEPASQTSSKNDSADSNEAFADFEFYGRQAFAPLEKMGVDYREILASGFVVKVGGATTNFRSAKGVGYYFIAPGKKPRIQYGVMTDVGIVEAAHNYFAINQKYR